jgi:hypothetical protein
MYGSPCHCSSSHARASSTSSTRTPKGDDTQHSPEHAAGVSSLSMRVRLAWAASVVLVVVCLLAAAAPAREAATLEPPRLRSHPDWLTVTTGATNPKQLAPQVWAITTRSNVGALAPFGLFKGTSKMSRNGIIVLAATRGRGSPTNVFRAHRWPPRLGDFRVDRSWEGQPIRRVQHRLLWTWVAGWQLEVRVFFGSQHPTPVSLTKAQAELNRLLLPRRR